MPTHIPLSPMIRSILEREAAARGVSLEEFLDQARQATDEHRSDDPLFADKAVYEGEYPDDVSENHDDYLYGEDA